MKTSTRSSKIKPAREILALNLRVLRAKKDLSQEVLALQAGINKNYVSQIESAQRAVSVDILDKIATSLQIPVADLLKDE